MNKRSYGDGGIDPRGPDTWRLRYRINGQRFTVTFHGSLGDARKELRRLVRSGETGEHVAPDRISLGQWVDQWIEAGAPGRRQKRVAQRSLKRYGELLRFHVVPALGTRPIQQIQPTEIDILYRRLDGQLAPMTCRHVHDVFKSCLNAAVRKGLLAVSPMERVTTVPSPGESNHGMALDQDQLRTLVESFRNTVIFPVVALAAFTGARRSEILALRWTDLDIENRTLRIERAIEMDLSFKGPKNERGKRTISIDADLIKVLLAERERHLRIAAGVPDGVTSTVDLSLIKLPEDGLMFPDLPRGGKGWSFTRIRCPESLTKQFMRHVQKHGFPGLRFHDLRGTHETLLLDAGVPVHVVAARCGHDPAVLLRSYAKRTRKADTSAAAVISSLSKGVLG